MSSEAGADGSRADASRGEGGPGAPHNSDLARYHRLVLFPGIGAVLVARARARATTQADRDELSAALRCQLAGAAIWVLHGLMQLGVGLVAKLMDLAMYIEPSTLKAYRGVLLACTILNVAAWIAEWLVVVAAGLNASRGRPYPLSRQQRRAAMGDAAPHDSHDVPSEWKPLNDG